MKNNIIQADSIKDKIHTIRGMQVILDRDIAGLYQIETRVLKQSVNRNKKRFPNDFMFILTDEEINLLVSQSVIPSKKYFGGAYPYAFTEQGVSMLASVLNNDKAIKVSIQIMRAFVMMRRFLSANAQIFQRLDKTELKLLDHDKKINQLFNKFKTEEPQQGIFFEGQTFDAYKFVNDLIKKANKEIILIDNFVDYSTLAFFAKRKKGVKVTIYTKRISEVLRHDLKRFNSQYEEIKIRELSLSHDRFIIIDNQLYQIGASLKDLGKKWFAFTKMEFGLNELLEKLKENDQ